MDNIRNFSIIAHIDHGKSTLADRLIQYTGITNTRTFKDQILDNMDIERERGITIKSQAISLPYLGKDGKSYILNLIDTPGHVDFSYEVSRSLASCEGVLLLIDAAQGVQAQTLANLYLAMEHNLEIIPVINKIDLPAADVERVIEQIDRELGLDSEGHLKCSAKEGTGIEDILEAIVKRIPPPKGDSEAPLAALIFDAHYDSFRGTVIHCRIFDGSVRSGDIIRFMFNGANYKVEEVGHFLLSRQKRDYLSAGEVGYLIAGVKTVSDVHTGDTITIESRPCRQALPGFKAHGQATQDIRSQCEWLLGKEWVARTPYERLQHLPRYLKAVNVRLEKLRANPARDAQNMAQMNPLLQQWQRRISARQGEADARLEDFGWMLQELRVSLFAQELKTPVIVSVKRLEKMLAGLSS